LGLLAGEKISSVEAIIAEMGGGGEIPISAGRLVVGQFEKSPY
jgi:hypothetical protein